MQAASSHSCRTVCRCAKVENKGITRNNEAISINPRMGKGEMESTAPAQLLDSGLCGLSLVAGYYRIAGDPMQLRHQLALDAVAGKSRSLFGVRSSEPPFYHRT